MDQIISPKTKKEIINLANMIAGYFFENGKVNLSAICADEGIDVIVDDYKQHFDGMLVWNGRNFFIHLNHSKGNLPDNNRGRFTTSHELGHYFIENHREGIRKGTIPIHASNMALVHSDKIEAEADLFAVNLLMPADKVRLITGGKKFSLDIVRAVSATLGVSLTAALLRFVEVGTHEIMVVFSENGVVKWTFRSTDFPKLANKFSIGGPLPPTSVAGESFLKSGAQYTGVEPVDLEDWFKYNGWDPGRKLYEQCCYSDFNNATISVVWFK